MALRDLTESAVPTRIRFPADFQMLSNSPELRIEPLPPSEMPAEILALDVQPSDWRVIVSARPNLLVEGPQANSERLIGILASLSPDPVRDWRQLADCLSTTVLVRGVDALTPEEQRKLMHRLEGASGQPLPRQVISTSTRAVFPLVECGLFLSQLYYRLNSVRLQVGEPL